MLLCGSCFEQIKDPTVFLPRSLDPASDLRLSRVSSPALRVGPSPSTIPRLDRGQEVSIRFKASMEGDQRDVPGIMDQYLSNLGVGLVLRGDERLPRRDVLSEFLEGVLTLDYDLLPWARASVRMGNVISLFLRRVATLPIEEDAKQSFIDVWAERAKGLYERSDAFPQLRWLALSNQAFLEHWCGDSEQALSLLDYVMKKKLSSEDLVEARIKKSTVLVDLGRKDQAAKVLDKVPETISDARLDALRGVTGAGE